MITDKDDFGLLVRFRCSQSLLSKNSSIIELFDSGDESHAKGFG